MSDCSRDWLLETVRRKSYLHLAPGNAGLRGYISQCKYPTLTELSPEVGHQFQVSEVSHSLSFLSYPSLSQTVRSSLGHFPLPKTAARLLPPVGSICSARKTKEQIKWAELTGTNISISPVRNTGNAGISWWFVVRLPKAQQNCQEHLLSEHPPDRDFKGHLQALSITNDKMMVIFRKKVSAKQVPNNPDESHYFSKDWQGTKAVFMRKATVKWWTVWRLLLRFSNKTNNMGTFSRWVPLMSCKNYIGKDDCFSHWKRWLCQLLFITKRFPSPAPAPIQIHFVQSCNKNLIALWTENKQTGIPPSKSPLTFLLREIHYWETHNKKST